VTAAAKVALKAVRKDAPKVSLAQMVVRKVVPRDAPMVARKPVATNAANAIRKAAMKPAARNARLVKPAQKAIQKVVLRIANRVLKASVVKAAVAVATAAMAPSVVSVPNALRVTPWSRTLQPPIRPRWLRPWEAMPPAHRRVARTGPLLKRFRTRVIAHKVTASPAVTVNPVVMAAVNAVANAVVVATTAVAIA
jgi:hypothetical protein